MRGNVTYLFAVIFLFIFSCSVQNDLNIVDWNEGENFELINGVLHHKGGLFSGELNKFFPNKQLKIKSNYHLGKLDGVTRKWFQDGNLSEERQYSNGHKTNNHSGWWPDGANRFVYQFNDQGQYEGNILDWFENGLPYRNMNYVNGKEVGPQKIWNNAGKLMGNYSVVNGDRFGLLNFKNCYTVVNSKNQIGKND